MNAKSEREAANRSIAAPRDVGLGALGLVCCLLMAGGCSSPPMIWRDSRSCLCAGASGARNKWYPRIGLAVLQHLGCRYGLTIRRAGVTVISGGFTGIKRMLARKCKVAGGAAGSFR